MNIPNIKELSHPFVWVPDAFDPDLMAIIQLLSLRGWTDIQDSEKKLQINQPSNVPYNARQLKQFLKNSVDLAEKISGGNHLISRVCFQKFNEGDFIAEKLWDISDMTISFFLSPNWVYGWGGIVDMSHSPTWGPVATPKAGSVLVLAEDVFENWKYRCTSVEPIAPIPRLSLEISLTKKSEN